MSSKSKITGFVLPIQELYLLTPDNLRTRDYTNVLTRYMLPPAAGLAKDVALIGFDGRAPKEKYFWKLDPKTQYASKMDSTKNAHPAFFRDLSCESYYTKHCEALEMMKGSFEKKGVHIYQITPSYIPALRRLHELFTEH